MSKTNAKRENFRRANTKRPVFYMQHWLAVATTLKAGMPDPADVFDYEVWKKQVFLFGHDFAQDNERFSKGMFFTSCGLPPKSKKG